MKKLIFLLLVIIFSSCTGKRSETVVIVGNERTRIHGKVSVVLGADGTYHPTYSAPGYVVAFRKDSYIGKSYGKAGTVYRINDKMLLEEIDKFDLKLTDDEIFEEYLIK